MLIYDPNPTCGNYGFIDHIMVIGDHILLLDSLNQCGNKIRKKQQQYLVLVSIEDLCARNSYQGQVQIITSHSNCGM